MRAGDKLHERAEAPRGWRTENVQARHRRFEPFHEPRVTVVAVYGLYKLGGKELVLGNVHVVSSSEKNMVDRSLATVVQADFHSPAYFGGRNNGTSEPYGYILEPLFQPARTGGSNGSLPESVLKPAGQSPQQVGPRHKLADACGTNVGGRVEEPSGK